MFDALPPGLPRLISVGRLDLNSEGLLLLTNDGELARRLELPSSGAGAPLPSQGAGPGRRRQAGAAGDGITVDGVRYGADRGRGWSRSTASGEPWISLSLAEGKNREVRKVLDALGLTVNRLIRVAYGPYELGALKPRRGRRARRAARRRRGRPSRVKARRGAAPGPAPAPPEGKKYKAGWAKAKVKPSGSRRLAPAARPQRLIARRSGPHHRQKARPLVRQALGQGAVQGGAGEALGEGEALGPAAGELRGDLQRAGQRIVHHLVHHAESRRAPGHRP